jgi:hypothetical protein
MMPLVFLFAGRNNVLLWLTNWSHSTYMLLHRWIARVFCLQALLHSIVSLHLYIQNGRYPVDSKMPYWMWGIAGTVLVVVLTFGSGLYVRRFYYEAFLLSHIIMSVLLIVTLWYHAYELYRFLGGYWIWLYVVSAVWAADRVLRIVRIVVTGPQQAKLTDLGGSDGFIRIDIPGVRWGNAPGLHAYFYFPTVHRLRPWENHPFSVLPSSMLRSSNYHGKSEAGARRPSNSNKIEQGSTSSASDIEKHTAKGAAVEQGSQRGGCTTGLTLFVRKSSGMTKALSARDKVLTLVEGPYPNNSTAQVLRCDRLLLIGGGIGITALIPFVDHHWNVKLAWSVKESARCLVDELGGVLEQIGDRQVEIGRRLDITALLAEEIELGWEQVGVVVSGPGSMCDSVRELVSRAAAKASKEGKKTTFELEVEAYSW